MELLVVVVIIVLIVAIAIPSMTKARMKANEASAVARGRNIQTAEVMYSCAYPLVGFVGNLANLGAHGPTVESLSTTNSCLIMDDALTSGAFELVGATPPAATSSPSLRNLQAHPAAVPSSDLSGQIRVKGAPAAPSLVLEPAREAAAAAPSGSLQTTRPEKPNRAKEDKYYGPTSRAWAKKLVVTQLSWKIGLAHYAHALCHLVLVSFLFSSTVATHRVFAGPII